MKLPHLYLVTFSGAQATGKSTIVDDLQRVLSVREDRAVAVVPSCSSVLFDRIQQGHLPVPGGTVPRTYADIDRLHLRGFFQENLPDVLATLIEAAAYVLRRDEAPEKSFILCDRWFSDIYAYTHVESKDEALRARVAELCRSRCADVFDYLQGIATTVTVLNVFVPLGSSTFSAKGQESKFRATCNRGVWEDACLGKWKTATGDRRALFMLTKTTRLDRVNLLLDTLGELTVRHLTKPRASARIEEDEDG